MTNEQKLTELWEQARLLLEQLNYSGEVSVNVGSGFVLRHARKNNQSQILLVDVNDDFVFFIQDLEYNKKLSLTEQFKELYRVVRSYKNDAEIKNQKRLEAFEKFIKDNSPQSAPAVKRSDFSERVRSL